MLTLPSPAKSGTPATELQKIEVGEDSQSQPATTSQGSDPEDVERFSKLPIVKRTVPADKWEEEVLKKHRRVVAFSHIGLHCRSRAGQTKDNIIIGVLFFNSSGERLHNGEQFIKWRLTDLGQPEPRNITVHLRWQACSHWRKAEYAKNACRGSIMAIQNPHLIEFESKYGNKETLLLVENPKEIEKLGECPILGSCKRKGCKLPCNLSLREKYCQLHLGAMYAGKSGRLVTGGADAKAAAVLGQKRSASKMARNALAAKVEAAKEEGEAAGQDDADRLKEERQKRLELALHLEDRRFFTAEANESYVKFVRKGMKEEDATMSRVPKLGRGLDSSSSLELVIPCFPDGS